MTFAKFEENRFRIDGEIAENHAILGNLTASIISYYKNYSYYLTRLSVYNALSFIKIVLCLRSIF